MENHSASTVKDRTAPKGLLAAIGGKEDKEYDLKALSTGLMHVSTREEATDVSLLQRISAADVIVLPEEINCESPPHCFNASSEKTAAEKENSHEL